MANCYRIEIDTIRLTSTGLIGGIPCYLEVTNWDDLLTPVTGNTRPNADGSPDLQLYAWDAGKQFDIKVEVLFKAQWDDLKALQIDSLTNSTEFTITATGDFGDFTVTVRAYPDKPFTAQTFQNGIINGAIFRYITV